jgi:hypothetical protein
MHSRVRLRLHRSAILAPAVLSLALLAPVGAAAQDASSATPAAGASAGAACAIEPRSAEDVVALFFARAEAAAADIASGATPAADPLTEAIAATGGEAADGETVAAIDETLRTFVACLSSGQNLRGLSALTDDAVGRAGPDLSGLDEATAEQVRELLEGQIAGTPTAAEAATLPAPPIDGPREAQTFGDGRASGVWTVGGEDVLAVFVEQDGRWLLDAIGPVGGSAGAAPAATPGT